MNGLLKQFIGTMRRVHLSLWLSLLVCSSLASCYNKTFTAPITASLEERVGYIDKDGRWTCLDDNNWTYYVLSVEEDDVVSFKCYGPMFAAFLTTYQRPRKGNFAAIKDLRLGHDARLFFRPGEHLLKVPSGVHYLYITRRHHLTDAMLRYLYINEQNVLDGEDVAADTTMFTDYPGDLQQVCIHHDSFCRDADSEHPWHIGSNGNKDFPMDYVSPRSDYATVDDGFRLSNGYCYNDTTVKTRETFRLVNRKLGRCLLIEVGMPENNGVSEQIVYNFSDETDYSSFLVTRSHDGINIEHTLRKEGKDAVSRQLGRTCSGQAVRFFLCDTLASIYMDDSLMMAIPVHYDKDKRVGMMIDRTHNYRCRFFNVFNLMPYRLYSEHRFTDSGVKQTHAGIPQGWGQDYSFTLSSNNTCGSRFSERYELRRETVTDYTNDRVEKSFNHQLQTNLRKVMVEFDVFLPADFEKDSLTDCIFQIHDRPATPSLGARSPYLALRVKNNHFLLTSMSIERWANHGFNTNESVVLADCKLGQWTHFQIYIKEGYLPQHRPLTRVTINGKKVYESTQPNCNNNPMGGYVRYGIYKASWLKQSSTIAKKVVYFDNFKVYM